MQHTLYMLPYMSKNALDITDDAIYSRFRISSVTKL